MEIGPIWHAMLRNKTGAILIAAQIAVTMAIMVNAISIMQERARMMARPSGIDEHNTFVISSVGFAEDFNERVTIEEDLAALRAMPGVVNAIQSNSIPLSGGGWSMPRGWFRAECTDRRGRQPKASQRTSSLLLGSGCCRTSSYGCGC